MSDATSAETRYELSRRAFRAARLRAWLDTARDARAVIREGKAAIRACCASTGMSVQTLRRWAFAADRFRIEDMDAFAEWEDSRGRALSIWHLVELARLPRNVRIDVLHGMQLTGWSLVKLREIVRARKCRPGTSGPVPTVSD